MHHSEFHVQTSKHFPSFSREVQKLFYLFKKEREVPSLQIRREDKVYEHLQIHGSHSTTKKAYNRQGSKVKQKNCGNFILPPQKKKKKPR